MDREVPLTYLLRRDHRCPSDLTDAADPPHHDGCHVDEYHNDVPHRSIPGRRRPCRAGPARRRDTLYATDIEIVRAPQIVLPPGDRELEEQPGGVAHDRQSDHHPVAYCDLSGTSTAIRRGHQLDLDLNGGGTDLANMPG
jgi:hypothetical protein